jgi:hypothetical protein
MTTTLLLAGYLLYSPLTGKFNTDVEPYSTSKNTEAYTNGSETDIQQTITDYHELTHVFLGNFGLTPAAALESAPGVKDKLIAAEDEALQNAVHQ